MASDLPTCIYAGTNDGKEVYFKYYPAADGSPGKIYYYEDVQGTIMYKHNNRRARNTTSSIDWDPVLREGWKEFEDDSGEWKKGKVDQGKMVQKNHLFEVFKSAIDNGEVALSSAIRSNQKSGVSGATSTAEKKASNNNPAISLQPTAGNLGEIVVEAVGRLLFKTRPISGGIKPMIGRLDGPSRPKTTTDRLDGPSRPETTTNQFPPTNGPKISNSNSNSNLNMNDVEEEQNESPKEKSKPKARYRVTLEDIINQPDWDDMLVLPPLRTNNRLPPGIDEVPYDNSISFYEHAPEEVDEDFATLVFDQQSS